VAKKNEVEVPESVEVTRALIPIREREMALANEATPLAKIRTQADRTLVSRLRAQAKDLLKAIHDELDPIVDSAHKTWQMNIALRKKHVEPVEEVDRRLKRLLDDDFAEQERAAEAKRKKLQAEADAKAEAERKAQVEALKKSGQKEEAAVLATAPVQAAPVAVVNKAAATAAATGMTFRAQKHMEIVDEAAIERQYLSVNTQAIQAAGAAYWEQVKPKDPKDAAQFAAAVAKFASWQGVKGVRFWITKESADTGRRG
jgi:hypothetical protein